MAGALGQHWAVNRVEMVFDKKTASRGAIILRGTRLAVRPDVT